MIQSSSLLCKEVVTDLLIPGLNTQVQKEFKSSSGGSASSQSSSKSTTLIGTFHVTPVYCAGHVM